MYRAARASRLLASTVWVLAATAALPAAAASKNAVQVDVAAGALDAALTSLATQTRQQVLYAADLVANRKAPALRGAYTPDEALSRLLAGSGIVAKRTGPNVVVLQSASASGGQPLAGSAASRPFQSAGASDDTERPFETAAPSVTHANSGAEAVLVDEVRVTGSNLRGVSPAAPVRILDQQALERTGQTTLTDALRWLPENFGGGASEGANTSGSDRLARNGTYGTALNLRGLGNNATLVLINGKRVSGSGAFGDFVDISTIPSAAVARVEVLLDGASAIYRS